MEIHFEIKDSKRLEESIVENYEIKKKFERKIICEKLSFRNLIMKICFWDA